MVMVVMTLVNIMAKDPVSFPTPTAVVSSRMLFSSPVFHADGPNKDVSRPKKPRGARNFLSFYNFNGLKGGKCEYLGKKTAK